MYKPRAHRVNLVTKILFQCLRQKNLITLALPSLKESIIVNAFSSKNIYNKIAMVELIGSAEKLTWLQKKNALEIKPPKKYASESEAAFRITFHNANDKKLKNARLLNFFNILLKIKI